MTEVPVRFTVEEDPRVVALEAKVAELDAELTAAALQILDLEASQKPYSVGEVVTITAGLHAGKTAVVKNHAERVNLDGTIRTYAHSSLEPVEVV